MFVHMENSKVHLTPAALVNGALSPDKALYEVLDEPIIVAAIRTDVLDDGRTRSVIWTESGESIVTMSASVARALETYVDIAGEKQTFTVKVSKVQGNNNREYFQCKFS